MCTCSCFVRFVVFDAPAHEGDFESRMGIVDLVMEYNQPQFAIAHRHLKCQGTSHLREELARIEALGGEGLMLRMPRSKYEHCRSPTLLKVVGRLRELGTPDAGRYLGEVEARWPATGSKRVKQAIEGAIASIPGGGK